MITYVNTVLVTNKNNQTLAVKADLQEKATKELATAKAGAIVVNDIDVADGYTLSANTKRFKIGVITSNSTQVRHRDGSIKYIPVVKWSNVINVNDIKSIKKVDYKADEPEKVVVDFTGFDKTTTASLFAEGGCTITLRITYKDMPTRYRKWTESYSYVTKPGDTVKNIIDGLFNDIMVAPKRQRVNVTKTATALTLEAMDYDDDEQAVTENVYGKVRFDVNLYYSNSKAPGWASNNKYEVGATIKKTEGTTNASSAKLVRDRERAAFDYSGVLHRCCWFDPQPKMVTDINAQYNGITIEFENMYRTADDLHRKTKQTVELYITNNGIADTKAQAAVLAQLQAVSGTIATQADQIAQPVVD